MSIVVVVKKAGKIVIASDTLSSFGNTKVTSSYISQPNKIHKIGNSYIGLVGATAHDNVFKHIIEKNGENLCFDNAETIFDTYLKMHSILKEKYFLNPNEHESDEYESSQIDALIANSNGIFGMYSLREVYEFERFWAIGSGMEYALGAMYSAYQIVDETENIAEIGVKAACEFDDGCDLPINIYSVELNKG